MTAATSEDTDAKLPDARAPLSKAWEKAIAMPNRSCELANLLVFLASTKTSAGIVPDANAALFA